MHKLSSPEFHNLAVIKTRPGIRANPAMTDSLCWNCATANGCDGLRENCDNGHHYDLFTCPSCRRMVPWSSGGTDSLDCADCWALTEERRTMEEKQAADALPAKSEEDQIVDNVRNRKTQKLTFPGQTMEDKNKVPSIPRSSGHICGTCGHDQTVENQAVGVGFSDLCTIRGSKIKSNTKALEKIIARQEKRIEELARENGNLACVLKSWEPLSERLFAATNSKGLSEAVAVAENVIAAYAKTRIVPVAKQE